MYKGVKIIIHIGDILAIPFFFLLAYYLYQLEKWNSVEQILFLFAVVGFFADILFTYIYLHEK
jgi:hypothetical protein